MLCLMNEFIVKAYSHFINPFRIFNQNEGKNPVSLCSTEKPLRLIISGII